MKKLTEKQLIISLIKDDLINSKLVEGLDKLGLCSGEYFLYLSDTVFKLLGFSQGNSSEPDYLFYLHQRKRAKHLSIKSHQLFEDLAREIYWDLYYRSPKGKRHRSKKRPSP